LVGSKLYKELEGNALSYFSQHLQYHKGDTSKHMDTVSAGTVVIKLLSSVNKDFDFFKERETRLVPQDGESKFQMVPGSYLRICPYGHLNLIIPSDESWLNISPELLDEMMQRQYGQGNSEEKLQTGLEAFLKTTSDFEGAEVGDELQDKLRKLSTMSLPRR